MKPVFDPEGGSVTAGNSSQLSDGASGDFGDGEEKALEMGLKPKLLQRIYSSRLSTRRNGNWTSLFNPKLLKSAGLKIEDIDLWELNEAFASQVVYIEILLDCLPTNSM